MNKNIIRLTEPQLHRVIKESVNKILNEIGDTPKGQKALKQVCGRAFADVNKLDTLGDHHNSIKRYATGRDAMERLNNVLDKTDFKHDEDLKQGARKSWSTGRFAKGGKYGLKESEYNGCITTHDDEYDSDYEELSKDPQHKHNLRNTRTNFNYKNAGSPKHISKRYFDY